MEILMPLMGEGVNEATLVKWFKKVGETVKKDEPLFQVSTDKVDTEIPSPSEGVVTEICADAGETVQVNQVLAVLNGGEGKSTSATKPAVKKTASATVKTDRTSFTPQNHAASQDKLRSTPLVKKLAREMNISLYDVIGTGMNGRINKDDLLNFAVTGPKPQNTAQAPELLARVNTEKKDGQEFLEGVPVRREKMSPMRKKIAEHMVQSVRTSPHVTTTFEVDMANIEKIRQTQRDSFLQKEGFKLTLTPFIVKCAIDAIKKYPVVNCSVDGDEILYKDDINIGCAVAIESGLIVPVIKKSQDLDFLGVARKLNDLVIRARSNKLTVDDVRGGTFSITNPGIFGSITSNPIISQPQVAILGVGAIVRRPVVTLNDKIEIRPLMMVSLTFDHRVVDGEGGAKYLAAFKEIAENFSPS